MSAERMKTYTMLGEMLQNRKRRQSKSPVLSGTVAHFKSQTRWQLSANCLLYIQSFTQQAACDSVNAICLLNHTGQWPKREGRRNKAWSYRNTQLLFYTQCFFWFFFFIVTKNKQTRSLMHAEERKKNVWVNKCANDSHETTQRAQGSSLSPKKNQ